VDFDPKAAELVHECASFAERAGMATRFLSHCTPLIVHRGGPEVVTVIAGLHGNERSGPLCLRECLRAWADGEKPLPLVTLVMVPLANLEGWDANDRLWRGLDPNRAWHADGRVPFVREIMGVFERARSSAHLDLHEDDRTEVPFVFACEDEEFPAQLARHIGVELRDCTRKVNSSEDFMRSLGVKRAATFECPPTWPLSERFAAYCSALDFTMGVAYRHTAAEALPAPVCAVPLTAQEENFSCGAAVLLSVLRYWQAFDGEERDLYKPLDISTRVGTDLRAICAVAEEHGLKATCRSGVTLSELAASLMRGVPPIVAIQAWGDGDYKVTCGDGHYAVLVALDDERAFFMDPVIPDAYTWLPVEEFVERWHDQRADGTCTDHQAAFLAGQEHVAVPMPATPLVKTEALAEYVNIDTAPYRNLRLQDTARLLAGAVRSRPLNRALIGKLIGRLVSGLESAVLGVEGRAEAERFARVLRRALADLADEAPPVRESCRPEYLTTGDLHEIFATLEPVFKAVVE
jgi:predicted double-glycine peptidase